MTFISINVRINESVRAPQVRLVSPEGAQLGIKSIEEALKIADEYGFDLVEVAPQADPPVCRIMDFGKYRYELEQKAKRAKKHQVTIVVKEIKLRPKIDPHDFDIKVKHVKRFLEHHNKVKATVMFRGREMAHVEKGRELLDKLTEEVKDLGVVEAKAKLDGRNMIMMLAPVSFTKPVPPVPEVKKQTKEPL